MKLKFLYNSLKRNALKTFYENNQVLKQTHILVDYKDTSSSDLIPNRLLTLNLRNMFEHSTKNITSPIYISDDELASDIESISDNLNKNNTESLSDNLNKNTAEDSDPN
ncbi:1193_t:CDS:2, partial [Racocetra persica]